MRSRAVLGIAVAVVAVVAVAAPGLAVGQSADPGQAQPTTSTANTTIAIHLRPDGDARFHVIETFTLDGTNESAAFRALGREFEDGNAGFSVSTFRRAANESSIVTGRPMNITNVTRNATITGENTTRTDTGRLALELTWTNFARASRNRVVVGDAFNTTQGTWLPRLTAGQTLLIESPPGYTVTRSPVGFTNGTLRWEGPTTFGPGEPPAAFARGAGGRPDGNGDGGWRPLTSTPLLALGAVVVLGAGVAVLGVYVLAHRDGTDERATEPEQEGASIPDPENPPAEAREGELLSDEERVERLLERNDGRMKQASIVAETGWSNAKVSQLLSAMDEAGRVDKLRIGRENLISLPDEE